ncbi:MAG: ATP-binding protein [Thermoleophilia bacterium]|nr:ATP-binding protein [Thermoleophilia bacterium]
MANIYPISASLTSLPAAVAAHFRASMESSALVGPDSAAARFAKIQWLVILWRFLTLAEVAIMAAACPSCYFPTYNAIVIICLGLVHTLAFSWLRARTSLTSTRLFYIADFMFSMAMMILARDGSLILVISFYATTALFVRPITRYGQMMALSGLAGASFLLAIFLAAPTHLAAAGIADFWLMFFFFGVTWVLICRLIEDASRLEIDIYLQEQRCSFRRQLHDDLGNTLCGLHFKIQSLFNKDWSEVKKALALLEKGYGRAAALLDQILTGIDDEEGCDSIAELVRIAEKEFDIRVHVSGNTEVICLNPAARQEVFSIMREAVANSAKHAGTGEVKIDLQRSWNLLEITVSDKGKGFELPQPAVKSNGADSISDCGLGLENMKERAALIGAGLTMKSRRGYGTSVGLSVRDNEISRDPGSRLTRRLIESDIYLLLVRLKLVILPLMVMQLAIGGSDLWTDTSAQMVALLTAAEAAVWYSFRQRLLNLLTRRPWLLVLDILFFCLLYFMSWRAGIPVFIAESASYAICLSAWFLGVSRNLLLSIIMGTGMLIASLMAPPDGSVAFMRQEELFIDVMDNLILAVVAAIIFGFIKNINNLRAGVVNVALERHRATMSADTHRGLYQLVTGLKHEIGTPPTDGDGSMPDDHRIQFLVSLEKHSTMLKSRLREIMGAIDNPKSAVNASEMSSVSPGEDS